MGLLDELKAKRAEIQSEMHNIDREAARVREQFEEALNDLRKKRLPLEERLKLVDALIKTEES
jgi:hypothetical protein